jgi:predicted acylesterase/phospholipase RssA
MELGFLRRVRESPLWPRVGWIFGTSAGALAGTMAVVDRLDDLERFLLELRPEDAFRPNRMWRLPLLGTHDYVLPETIDERVGSIQELAESVCAADRELVVCATDVTEEEESDSTRDFELVFSSRATPPEELAQAILASAAISGLVLPMRIGDRIATDGAWTRAYPLAHAYARPEVQAIVAFRYVPRYPKVDAGGLAVLRRRLERVGRVPPVRALIAELKEAEEREARGEPPHLVDMIRRLMRITVVRSTVVEERIADEKDASIAELERLRTDVLALAESHVRRRGEREQLVEALAARFGDAHFPFRHDRLIPRITVRGTVGEITLEPGGRKQRPWTDEAKRALIDRGYLLTDAELRAFEAEPIPA